MNKQKNKKQGFSFVELSIYVGIFGVVAFLLFNIFGEILNFSKIANKQDVEDLRYRISPIEFDLDFPKRGIVTPNPRIPFPPEDPVRVLPGMIQYCSFQWMQTECDLEEEAPCWVCECKEVPCDNVAGCAGCHHLFVEDPLNYPGCECVDIRAEMREKRNDMW